jgi:hypothetical protein
MPAVATVTETPSPSPAPPSHSQRGKSSAGPTPSLADQLADLETVAADANDRVRTARSDLQLRSGDAAREVAAELIAYRDAIEARKPSATPEAERPARERELTAAYCDVVRQRGLVLMPVGQGTEIRVIDPALAAEYDAALAESVVASRAVKDFQKENATALAAERRRTDADKIREAISGDDGDAIREALIGPRRTSTFTTADLPGRSRRG